MSTGSEPAGPQHSGGRAPQEPRWLNNEEMRAWRSFIQVGVLLNRRIDQQLKEDSGLSHVQYAVLIWLTEAPGGELRMTELAGIMNTSKSGLTYQVNQLEKAGLVRRKPDPDDVRGVIAAITEEGRRQQATAAPGHVALVRELLIDLLTPEQLTAIADGLGEVRRRLREHEDNPH
ncbi:MAG TPA: MarR family winged helix-turn-helix transcriptional regulator [Pseudonocardiaceae bacterium]|jgi:DNA-binding MarR family transcriptional regulator|nr:MarR family winged helix-turn-helix transcriptional regulator [Pseudonocardiaceae bacterium]